MSDTLRCFGIDEQELEEKRTKMVEDLKEYCKDNPDNCEKQRLGISQLDPNNWNWKRSALEALGVKIPDTVKSSCQRRLKGMFNER